MIIYKLLLLLFFLLITGKIKI